MLFENIKTARRKYRPSLKISENIKKSLIHKKDAFEIRQQTIIS